MNHTVPKVSVVLPYFNAEKTLERAVRSILNQSFPDFELILINNHSTDDSANIAWLLSVEDERIVLFTEATRGLFRAALTNSSITKGQYIACMDANCFSHPTRLEKQVALLDSDPLIGIASCLVIQIADDQYNDSLNNIGDSINSHILPSDISLNRFIETPALISTLLYRRELAGFSNGIASDYEWYLHLLDKGVKIAKIPEVLLDWYFSNTESSDNDQWYRSEEYYQIKTKYLTKWLMENDNPYIWVWGTDELSTLQVALLENKGIFVEGYIGEENCESDDSICFGYNDFNWEANSFLIIYSDNEVDRKRKKDFLLSKMKIEGDDFIFV